MKYPKAIPTILVPLAALIAALLLAPTASANWTSYMNELNNSGYDFHGPISAYMDLGNGVCSLANQGFNQNTITDWVVRNSGPGILSPQAQFIMIAAEVYLC